MTQILSRFRRRQPRQWMVLASGLLLCLVAFGFAADAVPPAAGPRRVLIIHSFGREFAPFQTMSSAFRTELARQSPEPVEFLEASIETARFTQGGNDVPLMDYLHTLFAERRLDLILTVAEPATQFCVRHRAEFFPDTPLLAHVDHRQLDFVTSATNATIAPVYINIPVLLEHILRLLPRTTNVVMILGASPMEHYWADQCRAEFAPFTNRVAISYLNDLSLEKIRERVAALPPNSAILYGMLAVDAAGVPYEQEKALASLSTAANAPLFGVFESHLDHGIIGGPLLSLEDSGRQAARLGLRLMRGEKARDLSPPPPEPVRFAYDWRQLRRWNISEARLPAGSEIRYRVPTFWEEYKWQLLLIHSVALVEGLLIFVLLRNRRRLRHAQFALDERLQLETLVASVGAAFVNVAPDQVDQEIERWMERMIESLDADRIGLFEFTTNQALVRNTHQATRRGVAKCAEEFPFAQMPWYLGELRGGKPVILGDLARDLPSAATAERAFARTHGTRAVMGFALKGGGSTVRAIDCVLVNRSRVWSEAAQNTVRLIGQIFALALERRETESQLRASEERLSLATTSARIGVWSWNIASGRIEATAECKQMFGWQADEPVTYQMFADRLHPEDRAAVQRAVDLAVQNRTIYDTQYRIIPPDGKTRWIVARGRGQYRNGETTDMLGVVFDITERRHAEEKFRLAVEASPSGIVLVDESGRIVLVNSETEKLFGYARGELIGQTVELLVPERLRAAHPAHRAGFLHTPRARAMGAGRELFARRKDGTEFPVEIGLSPIQGETGLLILTVIVDITARKQAEAEAQRQRAELAHVARVSTMGELAASVAHELNQPLGAILSNAEAAEMFLNQNPPALQEVREILVDIRKDDERAGEVIRRMRALLSKREMEMQPLDLNSLVADVFRLVSADAALRKTAMVAELSPLPPPVRGDRVHLQQVLLNLMMNAMEAMARQSPERRRLVVRTGRNGDGTVEVAVSDSGGGIEPDKLPRLFEPFFTTKPNGMGMGLAISRKIVEAHHGRIWAESNAAGGATLRFTLPVASHESDS